MVETHNAMVFDMAVGGKGLPSAIIMGIISTFVSVRPARAYVLNTVYSAVWQYSGPQYSLASAPGQTQKGDPAR